MPDANTIQDHISGMLDGKIGQLAREIAEDAAANLDIDFDDATDMKGVFQKLMKNPTKLMGLVKNVGNKTNSWFSAFATSPIDHADVIIV